MVAIEPDIEVGVLSERVTQCLAHHVGDAELHSGFLACLTYEALYLLCIHVDVAVHLRIVGITPCSSSYLAPAADLDLSGDGPHLPAGA